MAMKNNAVMEAKKAQACLLEFHTPDEIKHEKQKLNAKLKSHRLKLQIKRVNICNIASVGIAV
jgi:hypothetical protein